MKLLKKTIYFLTISILVSCSSNDDDTITDNGFKVNGKFYATDYAKAGCCSPYIFIFSSTEDEDFGHFTRFDLVTYPSGLAINTPLTSGEYTFSNNGIDDHHPVQIVDTNSEDSNIAYTIYGSNEIKSGTVNVHSVKNDENGQIVEIDLSYKFNWPDITVIGKYKGTVLPN